MTMVLYCKTIIGICIGQLGGYNFYIEVISVGEWGHRWNFQELSCTWQLKLPCLHRSWCVYRMTVSCRRWNLDIFMCLWVSIWGHQLPISQERKDWRLPGLWKNKRLLSFHILVQDQTCPKLPCWCQYPRWNSRQVNQRVATILKGRVQEYHC